MLDLCCLDYIVVFKKDENETVLSASLCSNLYEELKLNSIWVRTSQTDGVRFGQDTKLEI